MPRDGSAEPGGDCASPLHSHGSTRDQDQPADGLVFTRNGRRLHPQYVLNRFHAPCRAAGVPKTTLHDLRHLDVTLAMDAGTEMAILSKTVRHSTFSTAVNLYHHLRGKAARGAVDGIADASTTPTRTPTAASATRTERGRATHGFPFDPPRREHSQPWRNATTRRPHADGTTERPSPPHGGNGLRPAKTLVGTTGFEPATP
ncbi:hypothetical protein [Kitasatospora sp. NPDC057223]|uniref:hypothetical protein n=1 Tax=Kitasatospora sp. NPDC057223 TaxID=3346055 RepID=UPI003644DE6C